MHLSFVLCTNLEDVSIDEFFDGFITQFLRILVLCIVFQSIVYFRLLGIMLVFNLGIGLSSCADAGTSSIQ